MDLNKRLELARRLATHEVKTAMELGRIDMVTAWAESCLAQLYMLISEAELMHRISERAPYPLEEDDETET